MKDNNADKPLFTHHKMEEGLRAADYARKDAFAIVNLAWYAEPCGEVLMHNALELLASVDRFFFAINKEYMENCTGFAEEVLGGHLNYTFNYRRDGSWWVILRRMYRRLRTAVLAFPPNDELMHDWDCEMRVDIGNFITYLLDSVIVRDDGSEDYFRLKALFAAVDSGEEVE